MGDDDVVRDQPCSQHVLLQAYGTIQVMLVDECLDQHGEHDDVRATAFVVFHVLVEIQGLWQAVRLHEAFHEDSGYHCTHALLRVLAAPRNICGNLHVVVRNASIDQRSHGNVVWLDAVGAHFLEDLDAFRAVAGLREALHDRVVRHDVDNGLAALEEVGLVQGGVATVRLPCVRVDEEEEVEHEAGHVGPQLLKQCAGFLGVIESDIDAEEEHMLLRVDA
mmetsp:Transcript_49639/g.106341  ORF Transcript_49639/g.106341 Transcript_49639/m.106341 type:complete len:221 (-) Transcript_49639:816-1478(-)